MALTPEVRVSNGGVFALTEGVSPELRTNQTGVMALASFPAERVDVSNAAALVLGDTAPEEVRVSNAQVLALCAGSVFDPKVRSWTFTLDGHDMYVLRLGNEGTLVYDVTTDTWYEWSSSDKNTWAVFSGMNWTTGNNVSQKYGTNVIVGSDANGSLYFMNTEKDDDDSAADAEVSVPFTRRVTAQVPVRGYDRASVYEIQLIGTTGELTDNALNTITLSYSDDRGDNYLDAGTVTISDGDYDARATWRSLGSFSSPGRLFRIEDDGALRRIDSLTMNSDLG